MMHGQNHIKPSFTVTFCDLNSLSYNISTQTKSNYCNKVLQPDHCLQDLKHTFAQLVYQYYSMQT